jgi:hypothetical protein
MATGPVWASAFDDAYAAYNRGEYDTAFRVFRQLASRGDARAQCNLGVMYLNGHGVAKDAVEAVRWLRAAAQQGNTIAQSNLGALYAKGLGVARDMKRAQMWFSIAADRGDDEALDNQAAAARVMTDGQVQEALDMAHQCELANLRECD